MAGDASISAGVGRFVYQADNGDAMRVWTYRPRRAGAEAPVLFVLHGTTRNADDYRDAWVEHAERLGVLLVVPEFTKRDWPASWAYQQIGVTDSEDRLSDPATWASQRVEDLFGAIADDNRLAARGYYLYGHSAGGQFVHRMMLLAPRTRVLLALPANPGWYTLPDLGKAYPEGLGGTRADEARLRNALRSNVVLLLGEEDNDPNGRNLPSGRLANRQGPHRFARGNYFYRLLQERADDLSVDLAWRVQVVPGVGHSNRRMAPRAAVLIAEHLRSTAAERPVNRDPEALSRPAPQGLR